VHITFCIPMKGEYRMNKRNGINVTALEEFSQSVAQDPSLGLASFRVKTRWTGQTGSIATVDAFSMGGKRYAREFSIAADEPPQLLGKNTAPNP